MKAFSIQQQINQRSLLTLLKRYVMLLPKVREDMPQEIKENLDIVIDSNKKQVNGLSLNHWLTMKEQIIKIHEL